MQRKTVALRSDVYARLREKGRFGETFSDLISRLLDELPISKEQTLNASPPTQTMIKKGYPQYGS